MSTTPPGWYDDERGALRWWDGAQWTEHVQTPDPEPAVDEQPATADPDQPGAPAPDAGIAAADGSPAVADDTAPDGGYPPSAPPGYPGGFPGGPAPSGAFISATEPKKSKLWILWVVIGVVLLGIVILATVFIPILIGLFSNAGGGAATEDETAAVATVELYDQAWGTADCDKFVAATTEEFREVLQLPDCETFAAAAQGFIDSVEDYQITVLSVETVEDQITVETSETYTSMSDPDGNPTEEPVEYDDRYAYSVVPSGEDWLINEAIAQN